jgi:hypothetical protein
VSATDWVFTICLSIQLVCLVGIIYFNRRAQKSWARAEASWKRTRELWEEADRQWQIAERNWQRVEEKIATRRRPS